MKQGMNLVQLATEIERRAGAKKDYVAAQSVLAANDDVTVSVNGAAHAVNRVGHGQIAEALDIPRKYYDRMIAEEPKLWADNINTWLGKNKATKRLVRTLDGTVRAFLSEKYRPLENEDLAAAALPVLRDLGLEPMSMEITDTRFYLKVVDAKVARELEVKGGSFGDGGHTIIRMLSPAITIANSEVGMGALAVLTGLYDGFCSNLATFGERSVRKYHVGAKLSVGDDVVQMLSDRTRQLTDAALWAQIGDVVRGAFDRVKFDALADSVAATATQKIEGDPIAAVSFAQRRFGLTDGEGKSVLRHLIEGGSLTRFGLYNAITRTAQDVEDYDRATEFERLGGQLIELPASDWRQIAEAA